MSGVEREGPLLQPGGEVRAWAELPLDDGRSLLLPVRGDGSGELWLSAVAASELLRHSGIVTPQPCPRRAGTAGEPRVFLRPALPTVAELWPEWRHEARGRALESAGELIRRLHGVRLDGYGPLHPRHPHGRPLQWLLAEELGVRGFPAMAAACPSAVGIVEGLLETMPEVVARVVAPPHLSHNGLHPRNLLCLSGANGADVVGLGDPGSPGGWPAESDLAHLELALRTWPGAAEVGGFTGVLEGYGRDADPVLLAFFRALHVVRRLIAAGPAEPEGRLPWVEMAGRDMDLVHAAYAQRVRAAAACAGLRPAEAAALLPERAKRPRARPGGR